MLSNDARITLLSELLEEAILKHCKEQEKYWQKVPWLSLQVDTPPNERERGLSHRGSPLYMAWRYGIWSVKNVHIDLATGNPVHVYFNTMTITGSAATHSILGLASSSHELDARTLVAELRDRSAQPVSQEVSLWRAAQVKKLRLSDRYMRK